MDDGISQARSVPARVAFVGRASWMAAHVVGDGDARIERRLFEAGDDLEAFAPDVAIAFDPHTMPSGRLRDLSAATVGYLTATAPSEAGRRGRAARAKLRDALRRIDAADFDRLVSADPELGPLATEAGLTLWRSLPLPVADALYAPARHAEGPLRVIVAGGSSRQREALAKGLDDRFVLAPAGDPADLRAHDVGVSLGGDDDHVGLFLAAGLLLVSEPLSPRYGLEPGIDYLEATSRWELLAYVQQLADLPDMHAGVRVRGGRKAETFRASRLYARLLADLAADLAAFGGRRGEPHSATSASASRTSAG